MLANRVTIYRSFRGFHRRCREKYSTLTYVPKYFIRCQLPTCLRCRAMHPAMAKNARYRTCDLANIFSQARRIQCSRETRDHSSIVHIDITTYEDFTVSKSTITPPHWDEVKRRSPHRKTPLRCVPSEACDSRKATHTSPPKSTYWPVRLRSIWKLFKIRSGLDKIPPPWIVMATCRRMKTQILWSLYVAYRFYPMSFSKPQIHEHERSRAWRQFFRSGVFRPTQSRFQMQRCSHFALIIVEVPQTLEASRRMLDDDNPSKR